MGGFIKALSQIVLLGFCFLSILCCHDRYGNQQLFRIKALNDSLNVFMSGALEVPEANYPTCIYIFAYRVNECDYIDFQSYPGHEIIVPLDTTMKYYKTGIYQGRYLTVYLSPSMKKVFLTKAITNLELNAQERAVIETIPVDLNDIWFEADGYYRRIKHYALAPPDSIQLVFQSWNQGPSRR